MDQLFDMSIHHGGVFITHSDTHVEYARGTKSRVSDIDLDTFAILTCLSMQKILVLRM